VLASAYEQLRGIAASGLGGGWRYGAAVLAASGMAAWMASAATWTPQRPPADRRDSAAAQPQAGQSSSAPDQSLPAIPAEGGKNTSPACPPLLPAATSQLIAVMAQLTLHHARARDQLRAHVLAGPRRTRPGRARIRRASSSATAASPAPSCQADSRREARSTPASSPPDSRPSPRAGPGQAGP